MFRPKVTRRTRERRAKMHRALLMSVACLLAILSVDEITSLRGRFFGSKNIARTRRDVANLFEELGLQKR